MNKSILLVICLHLPILATYSQPGDSSIVKKIYITTRLNGQITLDGILNEESWNAVEWGGDFIQHIPNEGQAPSQQTNFKILYDDRFLYIAYRCYDLAPDSIIKWMGRRDEFPGDWVEINIDSYHDLRNAFSFTLSVSGVRNDEFVSENGDIWDANWNPIWLAKTHVDDKGWSAEAKIPLSQLRYDDENEKIWGFQIMRRLFRKEERSTWQFIPQSSGVWVSSFGELHGLKNIPRHRQVEIAPYVVAQLDKYKAVPGNPFATGSDATITGGLDGKYAVTNDLILDFTFNPDFGQIEADPSQVRIDGFQNFFEERRPFFIESKNIFDYRLTGSISGGDYDSDLLFYSRRIGSTPHGYPNIAANEFADVPFNTSILGAVKFSGKTKKGWSIGILESVTEREMAEIDNLGARRKEVVEPLTNYFVGRLQKDINGGNTVLGGVFTAVNREEGMNDLLHRKAYSGGLDYLHYWKNRTWYIRGNMVFSHVTGSKEAILKTQTAFEHLFQRAGAPEVSVDTNRTSLTGAGGTFRLGKSGGKSGKLGQVFKLETGVTFRSPELELNDIGFLLTANEINHFSWAGLQFQNSFSIFRSAGLNYNHWSRWDYSGQFLYQAFNFNTYATFKNNWQAGGGVTWNPYDISNTALRGASSIRRPPGISQTFYVYGDLRKKVYANLDLFNAWGFDNSVKINDIALTFFFQPLDALKLSLGANYVYNWRRQDQFVSNVIYNNSTRTVVGEVEQNTLRFTGRLNFNITPDLTLQYYGQPFITRPLYRNFAYVSNPLGKKYDDRFHPYTLNEITFNESKGQYNVDENADGTPDYSFVKPDFNFVQFRSNLVVRWEYKPGSELYLVWSQGNTDTSQDTSIPLFNSLFENSFTAQARNTVLIKLTYRFSR